MDYKNAGVDIEAGYKSVELMKKHVQATMRPEVLTNLGGFSGAFSIPNFIAGGVNRCKSTVSRQSRHAMRRCICINSWLLRYKWRKKTPLLHRCYRLHKAPGEHRS